MKSIPICAISIFMIAFLTACSIPQKKYVIGVSQCSEDSWRTKLEQELVQATYFNEDVELRILSANDNVEQQRQQITELVNGGIDLLIVSPQQTSSLSDAIKKATQKHIPVILFDRKSDVEDFTAYMGADNYAIGQMVGEYVVNQLGQKGNVVEISGEKESSPAKERHRGFTETIEKYPDVHVVGMAEGDWKQESGEKAMNKILDEYNGTIDCVFGGNDRMVQGARSALEKYKQIHPDSPINLSTLMFVGVDALPTSGGGIEAVRDGKLTASAIYPTHGDDLMALALAILHGEPYEKQNTLETSLVTSANANVLLMQYKEVVKQDEYIKKLHNRVDNVLTERNTQRVFLWFILVVTVIICLLLVLAVRANRTKNLLNEKLRQKNDELNIAKENAERQRDEFEEQRDRLLDATTKEQDETPNESVEIPRNEFMEKFISIVQENIHNADLSVEDVGQELCLSRVQLYRKVKAHMGKTPVEVIREERLKRANILLADSSLSVSEIAYRVGFSAPSYFTKCYKDYYGKSPSARKP